MQSEKIQSLIHRYRLGLTTPQEDALIERSYKDYLAPIQTLTEDEIKKDLELIAQNLPKPPTAKKRNYLKFSAAAALFIFGICGFLFYELSKQSFKKDFFAQKNKITPGKEHAILTLSTGRKIILDEKTNVSVVDSLAGISITKNMKGELIYRVIASAKSTDEAMAYNTIETPKGSQYKIILQDGSNVWLNAGSTLRYPVMFKGKVRKVELTGEGYFEVSKNEKVPFIVASADQNIKVLGTHFNVTAYAEEMQTKTTLLEGKVLISKGDQEKLLKPGEEVTNRKGSQVLKSIESTDPQEAVAWKDGLFLFEHEDLHTAMRKLARWYDVEVEYKNDFKNSYFSGTISKFAEIEEVLKIMELTGAVKFQITGRRIIVMK